MLIPKRLTFLICSFFAFQSIIGQSNTFNEIGIILGPVQFRSDYGERKNSKTNGGNSGFGIGVVHYFNFSYNRSRNDFTKYFINHFKIKNEISYNKTNLEHLGKWVDASRTSDNANKLRAHKGVAENLDFGSQLEFYPLSIRDFQVYSPRIAPYIGLGIHYTIFSPKVSTNYANPDPSATGNVLDSSNFYSGWESGSVDASPGNTFSMVSNVGMRYKLNRYSDLILDLRFQYYFNDWVDGLNHQLESNKNNDWLLWLNVGYIYYFD
ncbi:THC0290_0291 family protein [Algibacter pacificus]|uniref:THC0290_0291 family protein n=1 Tax=Algibacter pacificus TaxID=2599389 RepID=UPI001FEB8C6D|nr:glutamate dehydrogenase [Algibacter pacificus]